MSPRPGLPRDVFVGPTLRLIAEHGIARVTVDMVAAETGASKATIYRHWGSRAALIRAALASYRAPDSEPDTGSLRGDLEHLLRQAVAYLNRPDSGRILPALIDAAARDPEVAALRARHDAHQRVVFERVVARAVERGELPAGVDAELLGTLATSPFICRRVVQQLPAREEDIGPVVDAVVGAFERVPT